MKKDKEVEVWLPVPNHPHYKISSMGNILSDWSGTWKQIYGRANAVGYYQIGLRDVSGEKAVWVLIHRLVAELFVPNKQPVAQYDLEGNFIKEYSSAAEAARENGYRADVICWCCKGKLKTAYGFIWRRIQKNT